MHIQDTPTHHVKNRGNFGLGIGKRNNLKMAFWNLDGFSNLCNLDFKAQEVMRSFKIICLVETWVTKSEINLPNYLKDYKWFNSTAIRDKSRGRASGGLLILIHKTVNDIELIESNNLYIILKFTIDNEKFIVVNFYYQQFFYFILFLFIILFGGVM